MDIYRLPALRDNYIFLLHDPVQQLAIAIDPGEAAPVLQQVRALGADLIAIWHTHHHRDHIGGNAQLLEIYPDLEIYASPQDQGRVPGQTHSLTTGDRLTFAGRTAEIWFVPGHTRGHLAYYFAPIDPTDTGHLFCGDTLFSGGCGRLFEGTPTQMMTALAHFRTLPEKTLVWCAHEYTLVNLAFALSVDPENLALQAYYTKTQARSDALRAVFDPRQQATIPTQIGLEKQINPFLRWDQPALQAATRSTNDLQTFTRLREMKDSFR